MEAENEPTKEDFEPKHDPIFEFKLELQQNITQAKTLYVALYGAAGIYAESCMKLEWKIGHLNFQKAKQLALGNVYLHENSLYIIFTDAFKPVHEYYLAEFLAKTFQYQSLVVVDARQVSLLLGDEKALTLRYIKTSAWTDKPLGVLFKENVSGTAADLIAQAETNSIPLVYYVGIVDEYELSRASLEVFKPLENLDLKSLNDPTAAIKKYNRVGHSGKLYL